MGEIAAVIATDSPAAADALRNRIISVVETTLQEHPSTGRPGRVNGTHESVVHPSCILVYRSAADRIEILTVRHVARKWPARF